MSPLKPSGSDFLNPDPQKKFDGLFSRSGGIAPFPKQANKKPGGGIRKNPEPIPDEPEPIPEPVAAKELQEPKNELQVKLHTLAWDSEPGIFNEKIRIQAEANLPLELENITRIEFKVFALTPDGKRELIDKQSGFLKGGKVSLEATLFYPQYRQAGDLLTECRYVFSAKHRHSREEESAPLLVRSKRLTLKDIAEILEALEKSQGYGSARKFASRLDYSMLCSMAGKGDGNDPARMPSRFFLLPGADDGSIQSLDPHPECEGHGISVANLRRALIALGYAIAPEGAYDEALLAAFRQHLEGLEPEPEASELIYTVAKGDTLGHIARKYGLSSWRELYLENQGAIGRNPDLITESLKLKMPDYRKSHGERLLRQRGANPADYMGGLRYAYPWVLFSFRLAEESGQPLRLDEPHEYALRADSGREPFITGTVSGEGPFEVFVPHFSGAVLEIPGLELGGEHG
jgi:LysM repeat protein